MIYASINLYWFIEAYRKGRYGGSLYATQQPSLQSDCMPTSLFLVKKNL